MFQTTNQLLLKKTLDLQKYQYIIDDYSLDSQ